MCVFVMLFYLLTSSCFWFVVAAVIGIKLYIKFTTGLCISERRLYAKTVIITGATSGIGKETAYELARRGAKVILACRNLDKGRKVRGDIIKDTGNQKVIVLHLDLTSLTSVRRFVFNVLRTEPRLDVLINNAGAYGLGNKNTADKLNIGMQVNHFAPFLLTCLLLGMLKRSAPSRIVMVSSGLHKFAKLDLENLNCEKYFSEFRIYANSKLANILVTNEMARRLEGTGITVNSLSPGLVSSEILRHISPPLYTLARIFLHIFTKNALEGAQTSIHLAVSEEVEGVSGKYFAECQEAAMSQQAMDEDLAKKLWEKSESLVKMKSEEKYI